MIQQNYFYIYVYLFLIFRYLGKIVFSVYFFINKKIWVNGNTIRFVNTHNTLRNKERLKFPVWDTARSRRAVAVSPGNLFER